MLGTYPTPAPVAAHSHARNDGTVSKGTLLQFQALLQLKVVNAVPVVNGSLFINTDNTLSGKLSDSNGNALLRKTITIDGS